VKIEDFRNPPVDYRPVPFLSINDDIGEERLLNLAEEFLDKGWGGLFFHARTGLITPYMGNRWFNLVRSCVKRYSELGGRFWIYDEQGWPSGQGGGQVTWRGPELRNKILKCIPAERGLPPAGTIRSQVVSSGERKRKWNFVVRVMPAGWLPDLLEPTAVRAFIESTHDLYEFHVGDEFGSTVPGVFTDEPQYTTHFTLEREKALPWTDRLPGEFESEHGYSVLDNLPSLFFDTGNYRKVRYDFFSTVTRLFVDAYSSQIYNWCEERELKYTGHYEWEDSFLGQIHCIGSAMQHYEYMQQPGIDHLGRGLHNPWVEKQVASVASQLGKERVLSETYGVSGQSLSFHDRRWIGTWQFAHGINFLNHHLSLYSLRGERKRDYPPTLSPHQPWWRHNRVMADYFSRLSYILSRGRRMVDVLVVSSLGSAWCEYRPSDQGAVERIFRGFSELTENLLARQIDFEYGEEFIMARHGRISGRKLLVGRSGYRVMILPPMGSVKASTFEFMRDLVDAGGHVILVGERPTMVEGERSPELARFAESLPLVPNERDAVCPALKPFLPITPAIRRLSGADEDRLLVHRRKEGPVELLYVVNTDYSRPMLLEIGYPAGSDVKELVPLTGEVRACPQVLEIDLAAGDGRVFATGLEAGADGEWEGTIGGEISSEPIQGNWSIRREDPNVAVMDFTRWRQPGGEWSGLVPVWRANDATGKLTEASEFEVRYEFDLEVGVELDLVIEDARRYDVYVNGTRVPSDTGEWWLDCGFTRIPIGGVVKRGRNSVTIRGRRDSDLSIEDAYLLGQFAVRVDGRKTPLLIREDPRSTDVSDIRGAGYPFYAGTVELQCEFDVNASRGTPWIEFDELGGTYAEFHANGRELGDIFWRDYRLNADGFLKPGRNRIVIRLTNDLRNLLGPRHWRGGEFTGVNPNSFRDDQGWTDAYVGVPLGIGGLRVTWRDE